MLSGIPGTKGSIPFAPPCNASLNRAAQEEQRVKDGRERRFHLDLDLRIADVERRVPGRRWAVHNRAACATAPPIQDEQRDEERDPEKPTILQPLPKEGQRRRLMWPAQSQSAPRRCCMATKKWRYIAFSCKVTCM